MNTDAIIILFALVFLVWMGLYIYQFMNECLPYIVGYCMNFVRAAEKIRADIRDKLRQLNLYKKLGIYLIFVGTLVVLFFMFKLSGWYDISAHEIQYVQTAKFGLVIIALGFLFVSGLIEDGVDLLYIVRVRYL